MMFFVSLGFVSLALLLLLIITTVCTKKKKKKKKKKCGEMKNPRIIKKRIGKKEFIKY